MVGFLFAFLGAVFLGVGFLHLGHAREKLARRKRILDAPPLGIDAATLGGGPKRSLIAVEGQVAVSEQGTVAAAFSGARAVWLRTVIAERRGSGRSMTWVLLAEEVHARDFFLSDGSGQLRVRPQRANVMAKRKRVARASAFRSPPPELVRFLSGRHLPLTTYLGMRRTIRAYEETICEGDRVYAVGLAHLEAGKVEADGYRSAPSKALVLDAAAGELLLTDRAPHSLAWRLLLQASTAYALMGAGALLVLYALASLVFSGRG